VLTKNETSILVKGLKFCPTPDFPDPGELREDIDRLHKRLRQIAFYENPMDDLTLHTTQSIDVRPVAQDVNNLNSYTPFKHRKFKNPAKGRGPVGPLNLEAMILCNERDLQNRNENKPIGKRNVTRGERQALKDL
jgi:hypothetical protein